MRRIYYINSRNRLSGSDSDFTFEIDMKGLKDPTHVVLLSCYIPKSYYLFQDGSNTFTLDENTSQATITIPVGNYSVNSLKTKLKTLLDAGSPNGWTYTISTPSTGDAQTGKLSYAVSGNGGVQPDFIFTNVVYEQLGFEANSTNSFVGNALTSVNIINLQVEPTLFLHSDIIQDSDNVLQEIFVSNNLNYSGIVFENKNSKDYAKPISSKTNNVYRFYLTNESSEKIDLNGLNVVLTLLVFTEINWRNILNQFFNLLSK